MEAQCTLKKSLVADLLQRREVAFFDFAPIDDVVESLDIIRTAVLVVEVVCVFPYIEAEDGRTFLFSDIHERIILVRR